MFTCHSPSHPLTFPPTHPPIQIGDIPSNVKDVSYFHRIVSWVFDKEGACSVWIEELWVFDKEGACSVGTLD